MTQEEKLEACRYICDKNGMSIGYYVHIFGLDDFFNYLARLEYLKKKIEFNKQPRNSKGQFSKRI